MGIADIFYVLFYAVVVVVALFVGVDLLRGYARWARQGVRGLVRACRRVCGGTKGQKDQARQ